MRISVALLAYLLLTASSPPETRTPPLVFGVIGDTPYSEKERTRLLEVIERLNAAELAFVVHVGDIKSGIARCTDALFRERRALFERIRHSLVYTPGDNDWIDCHRSGGDPDDALKRLRAVFFPKPGHTLGVPDFAVQSQAAEDPDYEAYVENVRWTHGDVTLATVHLVRADPGYKRYRKRTQAAAIAWLRAVFKRARTDGSRVVVLAMQANPEFDEGPKSPFRKLLRALDDELESFDGEVLLIHGDTHYFRVDKPLEDHVHLTRLESFGSPDVHWVHVRVDPDAAGVFAIEPRLVR